jgi:triphosphoribosyl-dephospho-CoA synthetase
VIVPAPVLLGEEKLTAAELADAERQEAARAILSRRARAAAKVVDGLRLLLEQTDPSSVAERNAYSSALVAARRGRDLVIAAWDAVKPS